MIMKWYVFDYKLYALLISTLIDINKLGRDYWSVNVVKDNRKVTDFLFHFNILSFLVREEFLLLYLSNI